MRLHAVTARAACCRVSLVMVLATWVLTCCCYRAAPGLGWLHLGLSLAPCTAGVGGTWWADGSRLDGFACGNPQGPGPTREDAHLYSCVSALRRSPLGAVVLGVFTTTTARRLVVTAVAHLPQSCGPPGDVFGCEAHHV